MKFYLDTEFNEFEGELISMALVGEDGSEWYESIGCDNPTSWVAENVMPFIEKKTISKKEMQISLEKFLKRYDSVHIISDWPEDIGYFCKFLITGPGIRINTPELTMEIRRDIDSEDSKIPHNALADARALKAYAQSIWI